MEKSSVEKGQVLFRQFLKILKEEFIKSLELDNEKDWTSWDKVKFEKRLDSWCKEYLYNRAKVFRCAKALLLTSKYDLEAKYQFVRLASVEGYCTKSGDDNLLSPEMIQFVDQEYLSILVERLRHPEIGHILSYTKDMDLLQSLISEFEYCIRDGLCPRNIVPNIILPNNIDYSKEVSQNPTIDIYNVVYDDACVLEKWPTKIRGLVYEASSTSLKSIVYLNQDNIISLAKSLYIWGAGFGEPTFERAEEFYKVIRERISKGTLTIYDYQSDTLKNMKLKLKSGVDSTLAAPYTRYALDRFIDHGYNDERLDKRLKRIIHYNPENIRRI